MSGQIEIFGVTDVGMQREHNEDNFVICQDLQLQEWHYRKGQVIALGQLGSLLMVADGMGGTNAGEVASDIAQRTVKEIFSELNELPSNISLFLKQAIMQSHQAIVSHASAHPECSGMGTTAIIGWLIGNQLYVAWSGDSRCYIQSSNQMKQIGHDHSVVWEMVKAGKLTEEEAWNHPDGNIITQSLGDPSSPPRPDVWIQDVRSTDRILVCSDGLNGMLRDQDILQQLQAGLPIAETCKRLVEAANQAGGHDNITVLILDAHQVPPLEHHKESGSSMPNDLTKSEISRMVSRKNIWITILGIALLSIIGYEVFNRFYQSITPPISKSDSTLLVPTEQAPAIDTLAIESINPKATRAGQNAKPSQTSPSNNRGVTINPSTGQSKPSPAPTDSANSATPSVIPVDSMQLRKPSDILKDSGNTSTPSNLPVLKVPNKQELERAFARIIDVKAKALNKLKCMKDEVRKEDALKVTELLKQSDNTLVEMQQFVSFQGSKVIKLPQDEKRLALLGQRTEAWTKTYLSINKEADTILNDYSKKRFYTECAGN